MTGAERGRCPLERRAASQHAAPPRPVRITPSRSRRPARRSVVGVLALAGLLAPAGGCATLETIVQAPVFELAPDRSSTVRLVGPSLSRPLGGAEIQVWARVENPNPIGFTVARLEGDVLLADQPAAAVDLPLGLPLEAAGDTVIPLTLTLSFADVPDLADRLADAVSAGSIEYALQGIVAVDAGALGQPRFGPRVWIRDQVGVTR